MKGLIIAEPWISLILEGRKTWEMRSRDTRIRGQIGLIRKGSKSVVGVAELVGTLPHLPIPTIRASAAWHGVSSSDIGSEFRWTTAWVLENAQPLTEPVPYDHRSGAVIWVELDARASAKIRRRTVLRKKPG